MENEKIHRVEVLDGCGGDCYYVTNLVHIDSDSNVWRWCKLEREYAERACNEEW